MSEQKKNKNKNTLVIVFEINKKIAKRVSVLVIFLLLNFLIINLLAKIYYEFNSGADRSKLLDRDLRLNNFYHPKLKIIADNVEGRQPSKEIIKDIREDYKKAWYVKKYALQNNDKKAIEDFYTDSAQVKIQKIIDYNLKNKISINSTSLNHDINILFFSADGQVVYLEDNNVEEVNAYYKEDELKYSEYTTKHYKVVLLLEDGFWRIRHLVSNKKEIKSVTKPPKKEKISAQYFYETHIYNTTKEKLKKLNPDKANLLKNCILIGDTIIVLKKIKFKIDKNTKLKFVKKKRDRKNIKIKGINYYPQNTPWFAMWENYKKQTIDLDFQKIHKLGLNTIRIFIPYEVFGKEKVSKSKLEHLHTTLNLAYKNKLNVILTFFDFYSSYNIIDYSLCDRHLETIIESIKGHPSIIQYDIKNEPDLDFKLYSSTKVLRWLDFVLNRVAFYDNETPVTIGWYSHENADKLQDMVDYVSFHFYEDPTKLKEYYNDLKTKVEKPIVIQEFGRHSYNSFWNLYRYSERKQAKYHKQIQKAFSDNKIDHFVSWTLYDFPEIDSKIFGIAPYKIGPQKNYGFINTDGELKKSATYISGYQ